MNRRRGGGHQHLRGEFFIEPFLKRLLGRIGPVRAPCPGDTHMIQRDGYLLVADHAVGCADRGSTALEAPVDLHVHPRIVARQDRSEDAEVAFAQPIP